MTVGKKRSRIGGQYVVEIDADIRKLAKDRRGEAELRSQEIAGALMGQDHSLPIINGRNLAAVCISGPVPMTAAVPAIV